ncbi:MAG: ATP-binding protein [Limisphaerales bacterium]
MFEDQLKELCRKLKPILGRKADTLWMAYLTAETLQAKRDAEIIIQMLATRHLNPSVDDESILLPPPSPEAAAGEFLLGNVLYGGKPLYKLLLRRENFIKHVGIFSITGAGKSNVAQNLLLGLLDKNIPFLVVDWKRSYRALLTLNQPSVSSLRIYSVGRKTASPFNWNPLRAPPGVHPRTWINVVAETLEKSHISGQGSGHIFMEVLDEQFERFGFYEGKEEQFPNFFDANEALQKKQLTGRRGLWQDTCTRILATFTFGPAAGAFNARHPIKLEELLEQPVIVELDQELPKPLRVFFSEIVLRWIHLYRLAQGETEELRHVTFLEEVHNMFPKSNIEKQASNSLESVFREIRGFGEGLVNITQHPSLLPVYILGNCNTQIYLGLQHEDDIFTAKHALFLNKGDEVFLDRLKVGEGIVKIKGRINPCHVKFPLVPIKKGAVADDLTAGGDGTSEANMD